MKYSVNLQECPNQEGELTQKKVLQKMEGKYHTRERNKGSGFGPGKERVECRLRVRGGLRKGKELRS